MSLIPIWIRLLVVAVLIAAIWTIGFMHGESIEGLKKDEIIAANDKAYAARIKTADDELIAANKRASDASNGATTDQAKINDAYAKGKTDEANAAKTRVADYASGRKRVPIDAVCTNASGDRAVPNAPAAASGPNGSTTGYAELSPVAAGRFEATASQIIGDLRQQVIRLQGIAQSEHDRCNQGNAEQPTK